MPKSRSLTLAVPADQDVGGLDVPVDDQVGVRVATASTTSRKSRRRASTSSRFPVAVAVDRLAFDVLEHEVGLARRARRPRPISRAMWGWARRARIVALAPETLFARAPDEARVQELDGRLALRNARRFFGRARRCPCRPGRSGAIKRVGADRLAGEATPAPAGRRRSRKPSRCERARDPPGAARRRRRASGPRARRRLEPGRCASPGSSCRAPGRRAGSRLASGPALRERLIAVRSDASRMAPYRYFRAFSQCRCTVRSETPRMPPISAEREAAEELQVHELGERRVDGRQLVERGADLRRARRRRPTGSATSSSQGRDLEAAAALLRPGGSRA